MKRRDFLITSTGVLGAGSLIGTKHMNQPSVGLTFTVPTQLTPTQVNSNSLIITVSDIELNVANISDIGSALEVEIQVQTDTDHLGFTSIKKYDINLVSEDEIVRIPSLSVDLGSTSNRDYVNAGSAYIRMTARHPQIKTQYHTAPIISEPESGTETFEHGSIHMDDLDFVSNWSGNTGRLSNTTDSISGDRSLYMRVANTSTKSVKSVIDRGPETVEFKYMWNVTSTGALGDSFGVYFYDNADNFITRIRSEIDDTPEGSDQVVQPRIDGNNLYLDQNTVYTMRFDFNWESETYDFTVVGEDISYTDLSFSQSVSDPTKMKIRQVGDADGNNWETWIDDIYIQ